MSSKGFISAARDGILLDLRVSPDAKHTAIEGLYGDGAVKLRVAAPPTKGRANAELSRFLAARLGVPPSEISVIRGASSRDKRVLIRGAQEATARKALATHLR